MSFDAVMLDSPAQTPTPKSHPPPPPSSSGNLPTDVAMIIDENSSPGTSIAPTTSNSWDTKKYREELGLVRSRLQHQMFDIAKFRDPLNKPLVISSPDLASDAQDRMRKLFQERVSR